MYCKACNTRLRPNERQCPNCGRTASAGTSLTGMKPLEPPPLGPSSLTEAEAPDAPAEADEVEVDVDVDVELAEEADDVTELHEAEPEPQATPDEDAPSRSRPPAPASQTTPAQGKTPMPETTRPQARPTAKPTSEPAGSSLFTLRPEELRARIVERPEMVEPGLQVYCDPESGKAAGVGFETEVGAIDLLGVDASGALVVVSVAERAGGDPLAAVLERLGWVSKHVAADGAPPVRAIVLLEPPAPNLGYAARAVADSVAFKTYRVTVALDDVEP